MASWHLMKCLTILFVLIRNKDLVVLEQLEKTRAEGSKNMGRRSGVDQIDEKKNMQIHEI